MMEVLLGTKWNVHKGGAGFESNDGDNVGNTNSTNFSLSGGIDI